MSTYSKILELINGIPRTVDLSTNTLAMQALQLNGATSGSLTQNANGTTTPYSVIWPAAQGSANTYLKNDGAGNLTWSSVTGGVTSVALADGSMSPIYTISGSPVTSSGTLTFSLSSQGQNLVFAGPTSGSAQPSFRGLVAADIPSLAYANQALSNLASVAINASLLPQTDNTITVGSSSFSYASANIHALNNGSAATIVDVYNGILYDASGVISIYFANRYLEDSTGAVALDYQNRRLNDASSATQLSWATNGITIDKALILDGSTSGALTLQAAATTTSYVLKMPAAQGLTGQVLTDSDGAGTLTWTTPSGTGANTSLSNLSNPTSINQYLLPASNNLYNLGSSSLGWQSANIIALDDSSGVQAIQVYSRILDDTGGNPSVDWANRDLKDSSGNVQLAWSTSGINFGVDNSVAGVLTVSNGTAAAHTVISAKNTSSSWNFNLPATAGASGQVLTSQAGGTNAMTWTTPAVGTVTSVAFSDASTTPIYAISGSPVTVSGTLTQTLSTQNANLVFAGPATGSAAQPSFRSLVLADIPSLSSLYLALTGGTMSGALNMGANQINDVGAPTASTDAATKGYVDSAISGLTWKGPVKAFAASNVVLTGGTTLTIDGYSVQNGDWVILSNQTTASQNYVYLASGIGTAYLLTLVTGSEAPTAVGDAYLIENGTVYGNTAFQVNAISPNVTFIQFAGPNTYTFNSPLSVTGNVVSVGYDNSTIGDNGSNQLYVKAAGITVTQLATITDNATLDQSGAGSTLEIKPGGVGATQLASQAVTSAKIATSALDQKTLTGGNGTTLSVAYAPAIELTAVYNGAATLTANKTYVMRWGLPANSESAGNLYVADWNTASFDLFWVAGLFSSATTTATGVTITIVNRGSFSLSSGDTNFGSTDQGKPAWLGASGAYIPNSTFAPASGDANVKLGIVTGSTSLWVDPQMMSVS
jgi:hypothetical protein